MPEAMLVPPLGSRDDALTAALRARAFNLLLRGGRPVPVAELGAPAGRQLAEVRQAIGDLVAAGRMTVAGDGAVTGSLGLTVLPDRHLLALPEGDRYTWCALDAVGVFGALAATGQIRSTTPEGEPVVIDVESGRLRDASELAVLLPEHRPGPTVLSWCPLVNFFRNSRRAAEWAVETGVTGTAVGVEEAMTLGTRLWRDALQKVGELGPWSQDA